MIRHRSATRPRSLNAPHSRSAPPCAIVIVALLSAACGHEPDTVDRTFVRLYDEPVVFRGDIDPNDRTALIQATSTVLVDGPVMLDSQTTHVFLDPWLVGEQDGGRGAVGHEQPESLALSAPALLLDSVAVEGPSRLLIEVWLRMNKSAEVRVLASERLTGASAEQLSNRGLARRLIKAQSDGTHALEPTEMDGDGRTKFTTSIRIDEEVKNLLLGVHCERGRVEVVGVTVAEMSPLGDLLLDDRDGGHSPLVKPVEIGRELQEAILLLDGETAQVTTGIPSTSPRLSFAAVALDRGKRPPYRVHVEVRAGSEVITHDLDVAADARKNPDWIDTGFDVSALAGREASITFRADSDVDGAHGVAIGTPVIEGESADLPLDVILVSLDTVRADRLSLYGYERETSPNLDRLGASSAVFDAAIAPSAWTLPSHLTIFTGQLPERHGVEDTRHRTMRGLAPLLAPEFRDLGYRTVATTGGGFVTPSYGFAEGFERYASVDPAYPNREWCERSNPNLLSRAREAEGERRRLLELLRAPRRRPLFLFAHTYVAHNYQIPESTLREFGVPDSEIARLLKPVDLAVLNGLTDDDTQLATLRERATDLSTLYDAGVLLADRLLGDMLKALEEGGHLDRTMLVVLSDHGEELFERGGFGHRMTLYEELVRVPWLIHGPGVEPRRVEMVTSLADVAPTVRGLLGMRTPRQPLDGRDLSPLLRGERMAEMPAMSSLLRENGLYMRSLRGERLKLIEHDDHGTAAYELYDLKKDPREQKDRARIPGPELRVLQRAMGNQVLHIERTGGHAAAETALSAERLAELKALGYLGGK